MIKLNLTLDMKDGLKEIEKFIINLNKINKESVDYGYFGGKIHNTEYDKSGKTEAEIMYVLELGSESQNIPPRPVFRRTGESMQDISNSSKLLLPLKDFLLKSSKGKDVIPKVLVDIGGIMKTTTQKNFGKGNAVGLERNADLTISKKGRDDPLVDTGTLRDAMEIRPSRGGKQ